MYIFDVFNKNVAPVELELVRTWSNVYAVPLEGGQLSSKVWGIDMPDILVERCVNRSIKTDEYIQRLKHTLPIAFELCTIKFGQHPDLVIYNAGTDIHKDDAWGCMNIDTQGIYARDQYVFKFVMEKNIPIFMLPAGGYFKDSGKVIGSSIVHLINTVINPLIQKRTKQQQAQ